MIRNGRSLARRRGASARETRCTTLRRARRDQRRRHRRHAVIGDRGAGVTLDGGGEASVDRVEPVPIDIGQRRHDRVDLGGARSTLTGARATSDVSRGCPEGGMP